MKKLYRITLKCCNKKHHIFTIETSDSKLYSILVFKFHADIDFIILKEEIIHV